jgi:ABC-type sugar transport system substrate-binding protein
VNIRRRRHRRASIAVAAAAAAGLLLAACSSSGSSAAGGSTAGSTTGSTAGSSSGTLPKTLVFSPLSLQIPALKGLATGVQAYGKAKGWTIQLQDPNYNAGTQQTNLNTVINSGVAGALWIIAVNPSALGSTLKTSQGKGIPALTNGVPSDYGFSGLQPGIAFDVIDYKAAGTALGQQLGACINKKLGGNAQVLFSRSPVGTAGKADIENSAVAALKAAAPKATIVSNLDESAQATAQTDAGNALQGHPGINAVMATNDEGTLGAQGAFAAAGKSLPCLTGFGGGNAQVLSGVKSGSIYAVVQLQFAADMVQSFNTLVAMQADPKKVGPQLHVPQKILTAGQ